MNYWQEYMNWPLAPNWYCEICGNTSGFLEWGMSHALCRCNICHTQYRMKDENDRIVDVPICQLKPEYYEAWKKLWNDLHKPIEQITDKEWELVLQKVEAKDG